MNFFKENDILSVRNGHLYIEECDTVELAERFGTPLFVLFGGSGHAFLCYDGAGQLASVKMTPLDMLLPMVLAGVGSGLIMAQYPDLPVMGMSFEQQAIAYAVIQFAAIGCIMVSVYVLGADFWERFNRVFRWQKPGSS